jgi:hypothetical protein
MCVNQCSLKFCLHCIRNNNSHTYITSDFFIQLTHFILYQLQETLTDKEKKVDHLHFNLLQKGELLYN